MHDDDRRLALQDHWAAADAGDLDGEHAIYADDALLDYPQSGERLRGRANIQASRAAQPDRKRFSVRRLRGGGAFWVGELVMHYGDRPMHVVSLLAFEGDRVARETQYFAEPFEPGASRAQWVEHDG